MSFTPSPLSALALTRRQLADWQQFHADLTLREAPAAQLAYAQAQIDYLAGEVEVHLADEKRRSAAGRISINHTPGPWHVALDEGIVSEYGLVAKLIGLENPDDETLPNAYVLAAAPDLLDACQAALAFLSGDDKGNEIALAVLEHVLESAIQKAAQHE